jgi:hypothetical protein
MLVRVALQQAAGPGAGEAHDEIIHHVSFHSYPRFACLLTGYSRLLRRS